MPRLNLGRRNENVFCKGFNPVIEVKLELMSPNFSSAPQSGLLLCASPVASIESYISNTCLFAGSPLCPVFVLSSPRSYLHTTSTSTRPYRRLDHRSFSGPIPSPSYATLSNIYCLIHRLRLIAQQTPLYINPQPPTPLQFDTSMHTHHLIPILTHSPYSKDLFGSL